MSYPRTHKFQGNTVTGRFTRRMDAAGGLYGQTYPEYLRRWEQEMLNNMLTNKPSKQAEKEKAVDDMDLTPNPQGGYSVEKVENGYLVKLMKGTGFLGEVPDTFIATDMAHLERVLDVVQTAQRRATLRNFADMSEPDIKL